jgi:hypothetical protein
MLQTSIFNSFKTQVRSEYIGVNGDSEEILTNNFDPIRGQYPKKFTYTIHQYSTWSAPHTALPLFADSVPYTCKKYDYTFTGQNVDIIDLKLNYDLTYYVPVLAWTNQVASTLATASTFSENTLSDSSLSPTLSPSLFSRVLAGAKTMLNPTPMRNQPVVNKPQLTNAMGTLNKPGAQVGMDVIDSLFNRSEGDMIKMSLTIIGDPTLIRQDDWLYVPSPTEAAKYNNWETSGQDDFAQAYGHFRMDTGELPILVNVRSILDIDQDYTNNGLSYPDPSSASSALFSGQYTLLKVVNKFAKGLFTQDMVLSRIPNQNYVTAYATAQGDSRGAPVITQPNAVSNSQSQQSTIATTGINGTTARQ